MLKLVTLNIEGHNHIDAFLPAIQQEEPDIVCLQEVLDIDVPIIARTLSMAPYYVPTMRITSPWDSRFREHAEWGLLLLTRRPEKTYHTYYTGSGGALPFYEHPNSNHRAVAITNIAGDDGEYTIATTHFTWSKEGKVTQEQMQNIAKLLDVFDSSGITNYVICGDFNVPRGNEVYQKITSRLIDAVPQSVDSTIDPHLHKVPNLKLVVDYIFHTRTYVLQNVHTLSGVSDHKAIVGEIHLRGNT